MNIDYVKNFCCTKCKESPPIIILDEQVGVVRKVISNLPFAREVLQVLSRCESICGIFRISALSVVQRKILAELSQCKTANISDLQAMFPITKFLELLTNSLPPKIDIQNDRITLYENVAQLLLSILKQIQVLMRKPTRKLYEIDVCDDNDPFNCFPALRQNFKLVFSIKFLILCVPIRIVFSFTYI